MHTVLKCSFSKPTSTESDSLLMLATALIMSSKGLEHCSGKSSVCSMFLPRGGCFCLRQPAARSAAERHHAACIEGEGMQKSLKQLDAVSRMRS